MTFNLVPVNSGNQLPDYLKGGEHAYEDSGVGSGIAARAPALGVTTAKEFTITKDGKTIVLPQREINVIIVAGSQTLTKAWYAKSYVAGTRESPDCYSNDGKTPAPGARAPQCGNCASCPKNAFGSHPVTSRGKACSDRKMMVVVWDGLPDTLLTWNVATMTLQSLKKFDTELRDAGVPIQSVLAKLTFDPNITYPVVKIQALGFVDKGTYLGLLEKSRSAEVADLLRETDFDEDGTPEPNAPAETLLDPATGAQTAEQPAATEQPAAPKRTRKPRTPATPAADSAQSQETVEALLKAQPDPVVHEEPEDELTKLRRQLAEAEAAAKKAAEPAETPEEREIRELQEKLAALKGGAAQATAAVAKVEAAAAVVPEDTKPAAAGGMDVNDLLAKWQNS